MNGLWYFTYSADGSQPFRGGWTEIKAPDFETACKLFRALHPDREPGILNCAMTYTKEAFEKTRMAGPGGNFGRECVEALYYRYQPTERRGGGLSKARIEGLNHAKTLLYLAIRVLLDEGDKIVYEGIDDLPEASQESERLTETLDVLDDAIATVAVAMDQLKEVTQA